MWSNDQTGAAAPAVTSPAHLAACLIARVPRSRRDLILRARDLLARSSNTHSRASAVGFIQKLPPGRIPHLSDYRSVPDR